LLPIDPDLSAAKLRRQISRRARVSVAVIISDTFGRPFRNGQTNIAIGVSGIEPIKSYIGTKDMYGNILRVTEIAIADELASAAELVMGKTDSVPVAIIRGYMFKPASRRSASELIRHKSADIFRCGSNSSAEHDIRIVPHAHK
jgi:coenzyme F420-0:L-glutamate ligase/coenzyme F420-1:gamma-L-glutamate ligase